MLTVRTAFGLHPLNSSKQLGQRMTIIDQSTMANMTAALEHVCNRLPPGKDTHENRKRIADAMIAYARSGSRTLSDFESLGSKTLEEITG
jgi:hypothetical protein